MRLVERVWKGEWLFWLVAVLLLMGAAGIAWVSRHPDAVVIDRATAWPLVGPLARDYRQRYPRSTTLGEDAAKPTATEPATVVPGHRNAAVDPPRPSPGARPKVWITETTALREEPDPASPPVAFIEPVTTLPERERRGAWYGLEWGGKTAWAYLPDYSETSDPPLGRRTEPLLPVPDLAPDAERLAAARGLLAEEHRHQVGAYPLFTDVDDPAMVARLAVVVPTLEAVYAERYGLRPIETPRAAVVVFAEREAYERFKADEATLAGRRSSGHVGRGIVALYREGRSPSEVRSTFLHELVHLLNRRAIGPALPPWLDEGLSEDLSGSAIGPNGRLQPTSLAETVAQNGNRWRATGSQAALILLQRQARRGALIGLQRLCARHEEAFHEGRSQGAHYAQAGFFIRFLVERYPEPFRFFLARVSTGGEPSGESLLERLDLDWNRLDREFAVWLLDQPSPIPAELRRDRFEP